MMSRALVLMSAAVLTSLSVAAFTSPTGVPTQDPTEPALGGASTQAPSVFPYEYSGCNSMTTAIRIAMETALQVVPPPFEPLDGGHMFNANPELVDTGTAMLVIAATECEYIDVAGGPGAFAFAWIDIQEPSVGNESSPSAHDGYDLIEVVETSAHAEFLQQARLPVMVGDVTLAVDTVAAEGAGMAVGHARIDGPHGTLAEIRSVAPGSLSVKVTLANWHQTADGVALSHPKSVSNVDFYLTKAVTCTVAEGSILAYLIGGTDCTAANGQGAIVTGLSSDGYLKFWPDVNGE